MFQPDDEYQPIYWGRRRTARRSARSATQSRGLPAIIKPRLVIISGPPAAGKSTSARPLADALGYPLLRMDDVKERLADAIGPAALAAADDLGHAAVQQLLASARELLEHNINVAVEGFFQSDQYSPDFDQLAALADAVLVHIYADDAVLKERYEQRALTSDRHWIHGDAEKLGTLKPELPAYMAERLQLAIPQIVIDTTHHPLDISGTAELIRQSQACRVRERST